MVKKLILEKIIAIIVLTIMLFHSIGMVSVTFAIAAFEAVQSNEVEEELEELERPDENVYDGERETPEIEEDDTPINIPSDELEDEEYAEIEAEEDERYDEVEEAQEDEDYEYEEIRLPELPEVGEAPGELVEVARYHRTYRIARSEYTQIISPVPQTFENRRGDELEIDNTLVRSPLTRNLGATIYTNRLSDFNITLPSELEGNNRVLLEYEGNFIGLKPMRRRFYKFSNLRKCN